MLQYQGGKNLTLRHYGLGAELCRWLDQERPRRIFDLTLGGGSVAEHFAKHAPAGCEIVVSDIHPASVTLVRALAHRAYVPPVELSEAAWAALKSSGAVPWPGCPGCAAMHQPAVGDLVPHAEHTCPAATDPIHGFAGFGVSYGGMYYQAYGGKSRPKWRDPVGGMSRACVKAGAHLRRIGALHTAHFAHVLTPSGGDLVNPRALYTARPGDLVYLDIPYAGTAPYRGLPAFDHGYFWAWAGAIFCSGARVLVSEFTAPDSWRRAWVCEKAKPLSAGRPGSTAQIVQDGLFTRDPH